MHANRCNHTDGAQRQGQAEAKTHHQCCRQRNKLQARTRKILGQVTALKKMLDEPHECAEVLQQIAAIRGAANGLMREVMKGHLIKHVVHEQDEEKREADLDVVLRVFNSYIK